jgi:hypothetical protein
MPPDTCRGPLLNAVMAVGEMSRKDGKSKRAGKDD